jgi:hypothetical protein
MLPVILLGGAVLFLIHKQAEQKVAATITDPSQTNAGTQAPTFDTTRLPVKSKTVPALEPAQVAGISPQAPGEMPPYVYEQMTNSPVGTGDYGAYESPAME